MDPENTNAPEFDETRRVSMHATVTFSNFSDWDAVMAQQNMHAQPETQSSHASGGSQGSASAFQSPTGTADSFTRSEWIDQYASQAYGQGSAAPTHATEVVSPTNEVELKRWRKNRSQTQQDATQSSAAHGSDGGQADSQSSTQKQGLCVTAQDMPVPGGDFTGVYSQTVSMYEQNQQHPTGAGTNGYYDPDDFDPFQMRGEGPGYDATQYDDYIMEGYGMGYHTYPGE